MFEWLLSHASYLGIIVFLVLTGCGLPIPEEVPIILSGIASAAGSLDPWLAFASCLVGALLGDCVMYSIGYHFGHSLAKRHPRFAHLLHVEREATIEEMMRKHGMKVFLVSRFVVGLRSPIYLTAGILRISFKRFLLIDLVCATLVVGAVFWLSFFFGEPIRRRIFQFDLAVTAIVVAVLAGVAIFFWRRRRSLARQLDVVAESISLAAVDSSAKPPQPLAEEVAKDSINLDICDNAATVSAAKPSINVTDG